MPMHSQGTEDLALATWHSSFKTTHTFFEVGIMHLKKLFAVALTLFATIALMAGTAKAVVTGATVNSFLPEGLEGYVTNDVLIDFTGQYTGSQMIVNLDSGTIYQNEAAGPGQGNLAPLDVLLNSLPLLAFDTFAANGGPTASANASSFSMSEGAAINVSLDNGHPEGTLRPGVFTENAIDAQWNPGGGADVQGPQPFQVARVTLSNDANGTFQFIASADQIIGVPSLTATGLGMGTVNGEQVPGGSAGETRVTMSIVNGVVGGGEIIIPEPSTFVLLGIGLVGMVALKRRSR